MPPRPLLHPQRLEHRIHRIREKRCLELREKLPGDAGDVADAGHGQQDAFGPRVEGNLQALGQVLHRDDAAA